MMLAPVVVGYLYDVYDSYFYSLIVMSGLCIISSLLIIVINNPKKYEKN